MGRARSLLTPPALFAGLAALAVVLALDAGRGTLFFFDEWQWLAGRRPWTPHALLTPHNEHLSLVPVLVYKLLFATAGIERYWAYRVVLLVLYVLCAWLVLCVARRRVGEWPAVLAAGVVLFLGRSSDNLIWPFQITYLLSIAFGLAALLALEDRRDAAASVLLALSIASSGLGLPIASGFAVGLLAARELRARWWVVGAPLALWAVWYAGYGRGPVRYSPLEAPRWALEALAAGFGALTGQGLDWGRPLLVAAAIGVALWLRGRRPGPRLLGVLAAGAAFWLLTGLARAWIQGPETPRYLYVTVLVVVLAAVEIARTLPPPSPRALAVGGAGLAAMGALSLASLETAGRNQRANALGLRSQLGALALARDYADPGYVPAFGIVSAGDYAATFAAFGASPAMTPAELVAAPANLRTLADRLLQDVGALRVQRPAAAATAGCRAVTAPRLAAFGRAGLRVRVLAGTAEVRVRRFGDAFANPPVWRGGPGADVLLRPRRDAAAQPWLARVAPVGRAVVCA